MLAEKKNSPGMVVSFETSYQAGRWAEKRLKIKIGSSLERILQRPQRSAWSRPSKIWGERNVETKKGLLQGSREGTHAFEKSARDALRNRRYDDGVREKEFRKVT